MTENANDAAGLLQILGYLGGIAVTYAAVII